MLIGMLNFLVTTVVSWLVKNKNLEGHAKKSTLIYTGKGGHCDKAAE